MSVNSRFRPYRKFPHLSITNSVTRQGGSINIIHVTVYSFTVTATTGLRLKFISLILLVFLMITKFYKRTKELWAAEIQIISIVFGTNIYTYMCIEPSNKIVTFLPKL